MKGDKPAWIVKVPAENAWHKIGAAWQTESGGANIVLDVGVPIILNPGTKLVLVPNEEKGE